MANGSYTCGDALSDRSPIGQPNGLYVYPAYQLDLSGVATGATVTIVCDPVTVPNRFTIKASDNATIITTSNWRGVSATSGPWGPSLNLPDNYIITFTKTASDIYFFVVETVISNNGQDTWNANLSCSFYTPNSCDTGRKGSCGTSMLYGEHSPVGQPNGLYVYSYKKLDLSLVAAGTVLEAICDPVDVPNRFSFKDAQGNTLSTSDWRGTSATSGPWGMSLNKPGNYSLLFTKGSSSIYYFEIETVISNNGTDTYNANIHCKP